MLDVNPAPTHNQPEYSVSEISGALKRTVEDTFGHVRVRGEISGFKRAASGHLYLDLKDDKSVLNAVCWKGVAARLDCTPESGLEVICTGKLTTYPGRSNYQLVISRMEAAGEGALMALLEKRKKQLTSEGLFDAERKQELPYLPRKIGVVTSPTGSVIRDILHRISDRFPCEVMVWGVRVQGKGVENEIAAAISGFNELPIDGDDLTQPDVIIVARGGGSLEDLWCFNEEIVVRAAADSMIPLISAVGHETDTTLIDYAADKRAPTPTAAAEMAVPVRGELIALIEEYGSRTTQAFYSKIEQRKQILSGLIRGLPKPQELLAQGTQRLDYATEQLEHRLQTAMERRYSMIRELANKLISPTQQLKQMRQRLDHSSELLANRLQITMDKRHSVVRELASRIIPPTQQIKQMSDNTNILYDRMHRSMQHIWKDKKILLNSNIRILESLSHQNVLKRGFALIKTQDNKLISSKDEIPVNQPFSIEFHDGKVTASRK